MKMRLIATDMFPYAGRQLKPGDEFDTETDQHADLFCLSGRAKRKTVNAPNSKAKLHTTEIKAEAADEAEAKTEPETGKRKRYMRRDMRAEE
jgi:hypothetical protein